MPDARCLPGALEHLLRSYCAGEMPIGVALMHLSMATRSVDELLTALDTSSLRREDQTTLASNRLDELRELAFGSPDAWETVRNIAATLSHEPEQHSHAEAAIGKIAAAFDRAVSVSPEGSVALYSLGRPDLLGEATSEIVEFMRGQGLLRPDRVLLDVGCGIGRFELALAPWVARIIGVDISARMLEIARTRCAGSQNVSFRLSTGAHLPDFPKASFDCIFAVDSFPYIVQADPSLPGRYIRDATHLLKAGGNLLILNFSYRSDLTADPCEVEHLSCRNGLEILRIGERPFHLWDGRVFHLRKPL